jgi:ribosomal protein L27
MRKDGKKTSKDSKAKKAGVKDLTVKDARVVKGGEALLPMRKSGGDPAGTGKP